MISTTACGGIAALALPALPAAAQQAGVELGVLDCTIEGGTGFIIGSKKDLRCTFKSGRRRPSRPKAISAPSANGASTSARPTRPSCSWLVLAPSSNIYAPGALAGDYVGASAEVTAAVGAGANLLVGGSGNTFTLQPLSVQTQTGLNLAVGVTSFQLRSMDN